MSIDFPRKVILTIDASTATWPPVFPIYPADVVTYAPSVTFGRIESVAPPAFGEAVRFL